MEIIIAIAAFAVIWVFFYNSVISKKNEVDNAMGGLDASLKKRYDLIPNLVAVAKEFMKHESSLLTKITELRGQAMNENLGVKEKEALNAEISSALSKIMVSVENYPDLKSHNNMIQVQNSLQNCEDDIAASRRFYNTAVTNLNNAIEMIPTNIIARSMGIQKRDVFEIPEVQRQNVNVKEMF